MSTVGEDALNWEGLWFICRKLKNLRWQGKFGLHVDGSWSMATVTEVGDEGDKKISRSLWIKRFKTRVGTILRNAQRARSCQKISKFPVNKRAMATRKAGLWIRKNLFRIRLRIRILGKFQLRLRIRFLFRIRQRWSSPRESCATNSLFICEFTTIYNVF